MKRNALLARLNALHAEYEAFKPVARERGEWFNVVAPVNGSDTTTIYLYDEIGGWYGPSAKDFVRTLQDVGSSAIDLHVNSPGGSIFEGAAIHTAIAAHPATVTGYIDGLAASAASFILMACNSIKTASLGTMMIHDGLGMTYGNEADHIESAALLGKLSDTIATAYAKRAGGDAATWRDVMKAETWYNAEEMVAAGLADEIVGEDEPDAPETMRATFDLSVFNYAGRDRAPAPVIPRNVKNDGRCTVCVANDADCGSAVHSRPENDGMEADPHTEVIPGLADAIARHRAVVLSSLAARLTRN